MFDRDAGLTCLRVKPTQVTRILYSANSPSIAALGTNEPCRSFVITCRVEEDAFEVFIYLYLEDSVKGLIYRHSEGAVPGSEVQEIEAEATDFTESMGFMMEDFHYRKKDPEERQRIFDEIPAFRPDLEVYRKMLEERCDPSLPDENEDEEDFLEAEELDGEEIEEADALIVEEAEEVEEAVETEEGEEPGETGALDLSQDTKGLSAGYFDAGFDDGDKFDVPGIDGFDGGEFSFDELSGDADVSIGGEFEETGEAEEVLGSVEDISEADVVEDIETVIETVIETTEEGAAISGAGDSDVSDVEDEELALGDFEEMSSLDPEAAEIGNLDDESGTMEVVAAADGSKEPQADPPANAPDLAADDFQPFGEASFEADTAPHEEELSLEIEDLSPGDSQEGEGGENLEIEADASDVEEASFEADTAPREEESFLEIEDLSPGDSQEEEVFSADLETPSARAGEKGGEDFDTFFDGGYEAEEEPGEIEMGGGKPPEKDAPAETATAVLTPDGEEGPVLPDEKLLAAEKPLSEEPTQDAGSDERPEKDDDDEDDEAFSSLFVSDDDEEELLELNLSDSQNNAGEKMPVNEDLDATLDRIYKESKEPPKAPPSASDEASDPSRAAGTSKQLPREEQTLARPLSGKPGVAAPRVTDEDRTSRDDPWMGEDGAWTAIGRFFASL